MISQAADLIGDSEAANPEYFRAQVELIAHTSDYFKRESDVEVRKERVATSIRSRIVYLAAPTIEGIGEDRVSHIMIYPRATNTSHEWVMFIPPTRPEHMGARQDDADLNPEPLPPYGHTTYDSLSEAISALKSFQVEGQIVSNSGAVL